MTLPRLYPILDSEALAARGYSLKTAARVMLEGGVKILQIRHKGHWRRELFEQAEQVARMCRDAGAPLVVNDRADIAVLLGAGVHVGQDDLTPREVRRLVSAEALVGYSTHTDFQLRDAAAQPASYVALGPIFPTGSKQNPDPVVGLERLRAWRHLTNRPLVAIGGITRANALAALDMGADSVAVIGDLLPPQADAGALKERIDEWQAMLKQPAW